MNAYNRLAISFRAMPLAAGRAAARADLPGRDQHKAAIQSAAQKGNTMTTLIAAEQRSEPAADSVAVRPFCVHEARCSGEQECTIKVD